jgi:integrase/recombinase XerD
MLSLPVDSQNNSIQLISQYLACLVNKQKIAHNTQLAYQRDLYHFFHWLKPYQLEITNVDAQCINRYLMWRTLQGFKKSSSARSVSSLKRFYRYLVIESIVDLNPCLNISPPKKDQNIKPVLSVLQVQMILDAPNVSGALGVRDKAMLELLYATGLNVSELLAIEVHDLDLKCSLLRCDKNNTEKRLMPFGQKAHDALLEYLSSARVELLATNISAFLFLNRRGRAMSRQAFWYRIKHYGMQIFDDENVNVLITAQNLRRAFAVHMLENGSDVQLVQYMMGHKEMASTQQYKVTSS